MATDPFEKMLGAQTDPEILIEKIREEFESYLTKAGEARGDAVLDGLTTMAVELKYTLQKANKPYAEHPLYQRIRNAIGDMAIERRSRFAKSAGGVGTLEDPHDLFKDKE